MCMTHPGVIALCHPEFYICHCVIHQQTFAIKVVDFSNVVTHIVRIVHSILAKCSNLY